MLFDQRYSEFIDSIFHLLADKLDKRLFDYLLGKIAATEKNPLKISHEEIASELGTAREVISRLVKKLEKEYKVKQYFDRIDIYYRCDFNHCKIVPAVLSLQLTNIVPKL